MNTFLFIKIIAFITMVLDHIGAINQDENIMILRIIGRISFPLFCLLMAYGTSVTKHPLKKILKLFLSSIVAIPILYLYFETTRPSFLVTYLLFSIFVYFIKKYELKNTFSEYFLIISLIIFTGSFNFSYSWYGILLCYLFYKVKNKYIACLSFGVINYIYSLTSNYFASLWPYQAYGILAIPFIFMFYKKLEKNEIGERKIYDNKFKNFLSQNFFYIIYPLHLIILYVIRICIF